jgi:hypothetical protein
MIEAYVVRDPQGRVIGMSVVSHRSALDDVWANDDWMSKQTGVFPWYALFNRLGTMCEIASATQGETWVAQIDGYTLKREQVAL